MEYELYHHGILGMKWGVRRYQNKDGSLTKAGKKRYQEIVSDARQVGYRMAEMEKFKRDIGPELEKAKASGTKVLVPKDVLASQKKMLQDFIEKDKIFKQKYESIKYDIRSMDDGYDYVVTTIKDKNFKDFVEVYGLVGRTDRRDRVNYSKKDR